MVRPPPAKGDYGLAATTVGAALLLTEVLARFALDHDPLLAYRRTVIILPFGAAVLAATWTGRRGAAGAGAVVALYVTYFFAAFGIQPELSGRVSFGAVLGLFAAGTAVTVGHHQDRLRAAQAEALRLSEERRAAAEQQARELAHANAALRDFTHVVAHDLRNPVRGIGALLGMLERDVAPRLDEAQRGDLALVRAETRRLGELLEALLEYARVTRLETTGREVVRVADVLASSTCRTRFDALARDRQARIEPPAADGPAVEADAGGVAIILGNLVANAISHNAKPEPLVRVRVEPGDAPGEARLLVEDDGPGFSEESLARYRRAMAGHETPDGIGRSGFGMVIVARAAARLGGRVEIGRSPLGGAAIAVTLPAVRPEASPLPGSAPGAPWPQQEGRSREGADAS